MALNVEATLRQGVGGRGHELFSFSCLLQVFWGFLSFSWCFLYASYIYIVVSTPFLVFSTTGLVLYAFLVVCALPLCPTPFRASTSVGRLSTLSLLSVPPLVPHAFPCLDIGHLYASLYLHASHDFLVSPNLPSSPRLLLLSGYSACL